MSSPYEPPAGGANPDDSLLAQALARITQLEQALAASTATGDNVPKLTGPTHDLYLVDGTHIESTGAIPTHWHHEDGRLIPVAAAVERR